MDLEIPYTDRRQPNRPTSDYRGIWHRKLLPKGPGRTVAIAVASTVIASTLIGAWRWLPAMVSEPRFVTDSIQRDRRESRMDSVLDRLDQRVGAIYCAQVPPEKRGGCR